ncbi:MAG: lipopolysaccharide biosynthesis protein, partial [Gammaproteobacteria bacterium]
MWVLIGSLTGTLGIFDLGIRSAVIRFVAREHARGDHTAASRLASAARVMFLAAGGLVLIVAAGMTFGLGHWFTVPAGQLGESRLVLLITAASLCVSIQGGLYFGVLSAMQRLDLVAVADIVFELMRAALVVLVLSAGGGLLGLALIGLALGVLRFWFVQSRAASVYPELGIRLALPAAADVRMILSVSAYSTLIYTSLTVVAQAKTLIIGATLPMTMVAFYAIGTTLPGYANALNRPIAQTVHPRASRCDAIGDIDGLRRLVLGTGRYSALILGPVALTFLLRGESFIGIWMGREFREMSGQVLSVLALAMLFTAPRHVVQAAFVGSGRHKALAPWYILEAATVLALSLILIPRFGIVGAA